MLCLNLQGSVPALRWRNDKRLFAPMSTTPCGNVLTGEFVQFTLPGFTMPSIGYVTQFLSQVCVGT